MTEFDPNFGSALEAAAAVNARKISSVELTRHVFERIDKFQPKLSAFVYQMREEALVSARRADLPAILLVPPIWHVSVALGCEQPARSCRTRFGTAGKKWLSKCGWSRRSLPSIARRKGRD